MVFFIISGFVSAFTQGLYEGSFYAKVSKGLRMLGLVVSIRAAKDVVMRKSTFIIEPTRMIKNPLVFITS